jgi:hypothetical protein
MTLFMTQCDASVIEAMCAQWQTIPDWKLLQLGFFF